jgi:cytochrome c oxidase subunit 2
VAVTVVILFIFLIADFSTGRALASLAQQRGDALTIEVVGHQWWWEIRYRDTQAHRILTTANEIHVPVGRPVRLRMSSTDVIHSFWVPNLHGKKDLIPGYMSTAWFRADQPGVYRGQCAEFCGHQHAKMGLLVVAQAPEEFHRWYEHQLKTAPPPADSVQARGQEVFETHSCAMCHTIRGTQAGGRVAPDLTHLASRRTLAAAVLPNNRGHLGGWITDPQRIKPGTRMPPNQIPSEDLQALLSYLQSLK